MTACLLLGRAASAQVGAASMDAGVQESFPHQSKRLLFGSMPGKIQGAPVLSGSLTPRSGSFESSSGDEGRSPADSHLIRFGKIPFIFTVIALAPAPTPYIDVYT